MTSLPSSWRFNNWLLWARASAPPSPHPWNTATERPAWGSLEGLGKGSWEVNGRVVTSMVLNPRQAEIPNMAWCKPETHSQILGQLACHGQVLLPTFHVRLRPVVTSPRNTERSDWTPFVSLEIPKDPCRVGTAVSAGNVTLMFTHTESL